MIKKYKKAFTFIELIIVVTILAILSTIGFISYQGYIENSRDSIRLNDINDIEKNLELTKIKTGEYPSPFNSIDITFSGASIWKQGVFSPEIDLNNGGFNGNVPTDPLTKTYYQYSKLTNTDGYELSSLLEKNKIDNQYEAYVDGKYNGVITSVQKGIDTYFLAIPSIINSDINIRDYKNIISENKLVYNGFRNLPYSYKDNKINLFGSIDIKKVSDSYYILLKKTNQDILYNKFDSTDLEKLGFNIDKAYENLALTNNNTINNIVKNDTNYTDIAGKLGNEILCRYFDICLEYTYTQWNVDVDTNCNQPDIRITLLDGTTQIWAGCNSTIGEGYEFSDGDGGQTDDCWNYNGDESDDNSCIDGVTSNKIETLYSSNYTVDPDHGYDNIWGKLYRWNELKDNCTGGDFNGTENNEKCACQKGRRLPTNDEQIALYDTIVENHRIVLANDDDSGNDGDKEKVGWKNHGIWGTQDNLANFLKFPLTGYITSSRSYKRGFKSTILSSSEDSGDALGLMMRRNYEGVTKSESIDKDERFPVRCIKE